jgi:DNA polymerase III subunit delta'
MQFNQLVGHRQTKTNLAQMVDGNRIPHALMLSGTEGIGVLPLAIAMAQYIMCSGKKNGESCNECASCIKIQKLQHPDVHFSFPVIKIDPKKVPLSADFIKEFRIAVAENPYLNINDWLLKIKADNKAANITALECREIIKKLQLRPYEGGFKILIMWLPEYLGGEGNILLKLIEEPPLNTIMIFATEQYQKIIATIQSRVQLVQLHALTDLEIKDFLIQQGVSETNALQASRMAQGNFREANILLQDASNNYFLSIKNWFNYLFTNNGPAILKWVMDVADEGREQNKLLLHYLINLMGYMVRIKNIGADNILLQNDEKEFLQKLIAKNVNESMVDSISEICTRAIMHIERNINTKICLHAISLQAKDVFNGKSVYL